jgi:glycerol uptake facilitator-like aquaporin
MTHVILIVVAAGIGAFIGAIIVCMCVVSKRADEQTEGFSREGRK